MKKYIKASTDLPEGSALLTRGGELIPVRFHVPSTTYMTRGIYRLSCTDGQFLYDQGIISKDDYTYIIRRDYYMFLTKYDNPGKSDDDIISIVDSINFNAFAELRYAPFAKQYVMTIKGTVGSIMYEVDDYRLLVLDDTMYPYLQNNFVKVSRFGNAVEFRINSNCKYDWNKTIIDKCILKYDTGGDTTKYTIIKEINDTCNVYFMNATLSEILEKDKIVLSSKLYRRSIVGGGNRYTEIG